MSIKAVYKTIWQICQLKRELSRYLLIQIRVKLPDVRCSASHHHPLVCQGRIRG